MSDTQALTKPESSAPALSDGALGNLAAALSKAQQQMNPAKKDSKNPFLKSKYADLESCWEACRKALFDNELSIIQSPRFDSGQLFLDTTIVHSSGEQKTGTLPVFFGESKGTTIMQSMGSALTYARRYGLCVLVGILTSDDDGLLSSPNANATQPPQLPPQQIENKPKPQATQTAPLMMTGEQMALISGMVDQLGITPDQFSARLVQLFGFGDWHKLTLDQAEKVRALLQARLAQQKAG